MADEKIYTVNLTAAWNAAYKKRAKKSIYIIKEYLKRHAGAKTAKVGIQLNEQIWARGAKNPPRSVKIQIIKEKDDVLWAELAGVKFELPKKPDAKKEEKPKEEPAKEETKAKDGKKKEDAEKPEEKPEEPESKKEEIAPVKDEKPVDEAEKADKEPVKAEKKVAHATEKAKVAEKPEEEKAKAKAPAKESSEKK